MKPDITDKKENLEEAYQRPPLREEIEKFFREAKTVTKFVALGLGVFFLISIRDSILPIIQKFVRFVVDWANAIFVDFINTLQALMEWTNKHPEQFFGFIASVGLLVLCYYLLMTSLKHRHYIYQRFRIGHFSEMMWFGIGALVVQVATIGSSVYLGIWLPVLLIEGILVGLIFRNFIVFKQLRPTLPRPLTKRENKERLRLIKDLYRISKPYEIDLGDWDSPLEAMTRLALIADFYPDKLSIITYDEFFLKFRTYKEIEDVYTISFKDDDLYTIYSKRVKEAMAKMTSSSIVSEEQVQQIFLDYFE